jgi:iron complex outermembrane receptor protein
MGLAARVLAALAIVLTIATARARAQSGEPDDDDLPLYGATGVAQAPIAAGSELDPTASATVLSMDARPRALESLDEVLLEAPGARARRTGAFGGFTSLSLRGADAEQTAVLLGEIPIASPDGSAFDLSSIPSWLLSRVEVYRGGAPAWLGAGAIGGVLRLVPLDHAGRHLSATGSYGSFDLGQGRVAAAVGSDRLHVTAAVGLTTFGGRFPYVDDHRTPFDPTDDTTSLRQGADFLEGSALVHARGRLGALRLEAVALGTERTGGLSPPPTRATTDDLARRTVTRLFTGLSGLYEEGESLRLAITAGLGLESRRVSDPLAQVGQLARETNDLLYRATARGALTLRTAEWLDLTFVLSYAHESLEPADARLSVQAPASARDAGVLAIEGRVFGSLGDARFELRPSVRGEVLDAHLFDLREGHTGEPATTTLFVPTGRLGAVIEPVRGFSIAASGWAAQRPPSLVELFGDRAYLTGNAGLRPELSFGADGGVVLTGLAGPVRGTLDVRGFGSVVSDLIRYVRTDQFQYAPQNVAHATIGGIEASLVGSIETWLTLHTAFTWLTATDDTLARALPLRAPISLYARLEGGGGPLAFVDRLSLYADVDYVMASYADPANLVTIAGRARMGAGLTASLLEEHLRIEVVVRDVLDQRGVDVLGMPLPGRSVIVSVTARE